MRPCLDQIGVITAIGVSAILGWFEFALPDSSYGTMVASLTGQPVTQIVLDTVGKKGATVLMVSNVSCEAVKAGMNEELTMAFGR
jgi:hypothetical protein